MSLAASQPSRSFAPSRFPWARPKRELLLLVLVAVAALSPDHITSVQDFSRICLSRGLVHARLTVDGCIGNTSDKSRHDGKLYSNKAPGMAALSIPAMEAVRLPPPIAWPELHDVRLWGERVLTTGALFLLAAFVVGRLAEGLSPGAGGIVLVTFALGSLTSLFAATGFDHVPAAAFAITAFALAWRGRPYLAGLAAGFALLVEYESATILIVLGAYVALRGLRPLSAYVLGAFPAVVLLAAYNWAAFGAPWHNPLSYSDNGYLADHQKGLVGIQLPNAHAAERVLVGTGGLLVLTPALLAAVLGLGYLWQEGRRAEVIVCAVIGLAYLFAEFGYFDPYGGISPGPRFFIPAFPFLFLGLGHALARHRVVTSLLVAASVTASTLVLLDGQQGFTEHYPQGVWGALVRLPADQKSSPLLNDLSKNILEFMHIGVDRPYAAVLVVACAGAAFLLALPARKRSVVSESGLGIGSAYGPGGPTQVPGVSR